MPTKRRLIDFGFWNLVHGLNATSVWEPERRFALPRPGALKNNPKSDIRNPKSFRGAVLFEVLLSVALFAGAAAFTLAAVRSAYTAMERMRLQHEAVDLAKSKIAELEAGLITLADLRGSRSEQRRHDWIFDLKSRRTEFTGLTLLELTVTQDIAESAEITPMSYTLRQLVALRPGEGGDE